MSKRQDFFKVVEEANKIHNSKYSYPEQIYFNNLTKFEIICSQHGSFWQNKINHINNSSGCPNCKKIILSNLNLKTFDKFIEQAHLKHNNFYIYPQQKLNGIDVPIHIICPIHGSFYQTQHSHLSGNKCRKCSNDKLSKMYLKNLEQFKKEASFVHKNFYIYTKTNYLGNNKKIEIICPKHKEFWQIANDHLSGHGCPKCHYRISILEEKWLDNFNILKENRQKFIPIANHKWKVDGYDPETNTIYEFLGDYWHGNLNKFKFDDINAINKKTMKQLNDETFNRIAILKNAGYNVVYIWESEFKLNITERQNIYSR